MDERFLAKKSGSYANHLMPWVVFDTEASRQISCFCDEEDAERFAAFKNEQVKVVAKVLPDDTYEDDCEHPGKFVTWHRRRNLGDINYPHHEDFLDSVSEHAIQIPIYIYEHGSIALSVGGPAVACQFDSGQVGVWVFEPDECKEIWGPKSDEWEGKAYEFAKAMCEYLTDVYNGNVWGFVIESGGGEVEDSCWGFVGDNALEDMKDNVEEKYHKLLEQAWEDRFGF